MKTSALIAATLVALVGASPLVHAADTTPTDKSMVMSKLDPDSDGTVSRDEAMQAAATKFAALDTDSEGTLDATELTGIMSAKQIAAAACLTGDRQQQAEIAAELMGVSVAVAAAEAGRLARDDRATITVPASSRDKARLRTVVIERRSRPVSRAKPQDLPAGGAGVAGFSAPDGAARGSPRFPGVRAR